MLMEIGQIQKWLAKRYNLKVEGSGFHARVVGEVPDCEHLIPVGVHEELCIVRLKEDKIHILTKLDLTDLRMKVLDRVRYWMDSATDPRVVNVKVKGEKVANMDFSKLNDDELVAVLEKVIEKSCRRS